MKDKQNWILKPNKWFDNKGRDYRFYSMIIIFTVCFAIGELLRIRYLGMFLFALIGLYRISYFIIMDTRRIKQYEKMASS